MPCKLHYFDSAGRASALRLMLKIGKVDFEDVRYSKDEWLQFKAKTPLGQMPVLELECGTMIPQSLAILDFAARKAGWVPECPVENAKVSAVVLSMNDIWSIVVTWVHADDETKEKIKGKVGEEVTAAIKKLDTYVAKFEKDGYLLGKGKDTAADLVLADFVYLPPPPFPMPFDHTALFKANAPTVMRIADRFRKSHAEQWKSQQPNYVE